VKRPRTWRRPGPGSRPGEAVGAAVGEGYRSATQGRGRAADTREEGPVLVDQEHAGRSAGEVGLGLRQLGERSLECPVGREALEVVSGLVADLPASNDSLLPIAVPGEALEPVPQLSVHESDSTPGQGVAVPPLEREPSRPQIFNHIHGDLYQGFNGAAT